MPFPPTFDRAWDETFPPDTQLANLLGQDVRNFKTDIRERLSLLSGTFANRPTNMDAIYGGVGYGMLYFATDTKQVFQWNGAVWVDVSSSFVGGGFKLEGVNVVPVTVVNTNALTPLQAIALAANEIGASQTFYVDVTGVAGSVATPTLILGLYLDNVLLGNITPLVGNRNLVANTPWTVRVFITGVTTGVAGTVTAAVLFWNDGSGFGFIPPNVTPNGTVVIDTTSSHSLRLQAQWGTASLSNTITSNAMTAYRVG